MFELIEPMISIDTVRQLALALPGVEEQDHWDKPSFRIKKKIFATLRVADKRAVLKLSPVEQFVLTDFDKTIFYPVEGGWGRQGWTMVELKKVSKKVFKEALESAWAGIAPKSLKS